MQKVTIGCLAVVGTAFALYLAWSRPEHNALSPINAITKEDRKLLEPLCAELLRCTGVGYTLFGDKPVSCIVFPLSPLGSVSGLPTKYIHACFRLFPKYKTVLCGEKFHISIDKNERFYFVHLINKPVFIATVEKNLKVFQGVLGDSVTPSILLKDICDGRPYEEALHNDEALMGILYGFGLNNARLYCRRGYIRRQLNSPPWTCRCNGFFEKTDLLGPGTISADIVPTPPFATIQEELESIERKALNISSLLDLDILSSALLPGFIADPDDQETVALIEKYRQQRRLIAQVLSSENFFEVTLTKFMEPQGAM